MVTASSPELHVSFSNRQLEDILEFFYGQLSSLSAAVKTATNTLQQTSETSNDEEVSASSLLSLLLNYMNL